MFIRLTKLTPVVNESKNLIAFRGTIPHYNESEILINPDSIKVIECFDCVTRLYFDDSLKVIMLVKETPERIMTIIRHTTNEQES